MPMKFAKDLERLVDGEFQAVRVAHFLVAAEGHRVRTEARVRSRRDVARDLGTKREKKEKMTQKGTEWHKQQVGIERALFLTRGPSAITSDTHAWEVPQWILDRL